MGKYEQEFLIDASKAVASVDKLILQEERLQAALTNSEKVAKETFGKSATAADNYNKKLGEGILIQQKVKNSTEAFKKEVERLNAVYGELRGQQSKFIAEARFDEYKKKVKEIEERIVQLGGTIRKTGSGDYFKPQLSILERLKRQADIYKKGIQEATNPELLAKYNRKLEETENALKKVQNAGKKGFDDVGNKIEGVNGTAQRFMGTLGGVLGALGITFGISTIVDFARELFGIAQKAEGIELAFARIGSQQILEDLRKQTKGTVSDLELMKAAVNASNFKVPLDVLGKGLAFAQKTAKDTGKDLDYLINSFVDGIGRKSKLKIDNLGISFNELTAEIAKTGNFANAVGNIIDRRMSEAGDSMDTLNEKTKRNMATWENFKQWFSKNLRETMNPLSVDTEAVLKNADKLKSKLDLKDVTKYNKEEIDRFINDLTAAKTKLDNEVNSLKNKIGQGGTVKDFRGENIGSTDIEDKRLQNKIRNTKEEAAATLNVINQLKTQSKELEYQERLRKNILTITEMQAKVTDLRTEAESIIPDRDSEIARRTKLLKEADQLQAEIDKIMGKADKKMAAAIKKANDERARLLREAYKELAELNKELEKEYQRARLDALDKDSKDYQYELLQQQLAEVAILEASVKAANKKLYKLSEGKAGSKNGELTDLQREKFGLLNENRYKEYFENIAKIDKAESDLLFDLRRQTDEKELEAISRNYDERIKKARAAGKEFLAIELENARDRESKSTKLNQGIKNNTDQEALTVAEIGNTKFSGLNPAANERFKQQQILDVQIEFAKKRIELWEKLGGAENQLAIEQTKKLISDLQKKTEAAAKDKPDILDLLGIKPEDKDKIKEAFNEMMGAVSDFVNSYVNQMVRMADQAVEEKDRAIEDKRDEIDTEIALHKEGFASNVETKRAELDELKKQRESALEEQKKAQKLQNTLDTARQVQSLITAGTEIFKVTAALNIVPGVGLAIAAGLISAMFVATQVMKAKAANITKAEHGFSSVGGKRHTQGGNKYRSIDDHNDVLEIEEGERIVNRKSNSKWWDLLEAINADNEQQVYEAAMNKMLLENNIQPLPAFKFKQIDTGPVPDLPMNWKVINRVIVDSKRVKESEKSPVSNDINGQLTYLNEKVNELVKEAKKPKTQYLPDRKITTNGNYTRETKQR